VPDEDQLAAWASMVHPSGGTVPALKFSVINDWAGINTLNINKKDRRCSLLFMEIWY
jgi:hypothetical protein